ncbi:MAG: DNA polymerase/3'-5' exonuclease PolX, partial [Myxococcales bacterium]|nr:DNA polymerase/3'-5' exonuclease PolX [Myxococcales bacterium]
GDPQSFRVRAYETAIHGLEAYAGDPSGLTLAQLQKIAGIGKSTAGKLRELWDGGKVEKLEALRQKHPRAILELMRIPGVGPKMVHRLRSDLGVQNVDDLERAVQQQKLRDMKGFGQKTEEKLAVALARRRAMGDPTRTPISVALPLAKRIVAEISEIAGVEHAAYCGSLRRFSETVGDLDIVVASANAAPVMDYVANMSMVESVIGRGDTKTSVLTRKGIQIDVRVVASEQLGAALCYFTGNKGHNIKMRQRAIDRGWLLNEYGLLEPDGKVVAQRTEEEIYKALGLPWIHPVLREDQGEIDLAEKGALPAMVTPEMIHGDFHVHTSLSGDGRSNLPDVVAAAKARGLKVIAITEHAENLSLNGVQRDDLLGQRAEILALQREVGDSMRILHGIELNIGPEGELDYDADFRKAFDFCLASIHDRFELDMAKQTKRVIRAMEDPSVKMIGHLQARMIGARPPVDLDISAVLDAAERTNTSIEINGGLPRLDATLDVLRAARGRKVELVLTSDAHKADELDRVEYAALHAAKAWVPLAQIVNTMSAAELLAWASR